MPLIRPLSSNHSSVSGFGKCMAALLRCHSLLGWASVVFLWLHCPGHCVPRQHPALQLARLGHGLWHILHQPRSLLTATFVCNRLACLVRHRAWLPTIPSRKLERLLEGRAAGRQAGTPLWAVGQARTYLPMQILRSTIRLTSTRTFLRACRSQAAQTQLHV